MAPKKKKKTTPKFTEKRISSNKGKKLTKKKMGRKPVYKPSSKKTRKIDRELVEIYENRDGSMPDMSSFKSRGKTSIFRAFITLAVALVFLGSVAWLGFFVLQPSLDFSQDDVLLTVTGEDNIKVGEEVQYRLRYKNNQSVQINDVRLEVRYPEGFVFSSASKEPSKDTGDAWVLEPLKEGEGGIIDIFGRFYADLGEEQSVRAFLNYTPGNFSSAFQKATSFNVSSNDSIVKLSSNVSTEVAKGMETPLSFDIEGLGDLEGEIEKVYFIVESESFTKKESEQEATSDDLLEWQLDKSENKQTIKMSGSFDGEDKVTLLAQVVGVLEGENIDDGFVLADETIEISLVETNVATTVIINGGIGDLSVQPSEKLHTSVVVKNTGETTLEDVRVRLVYEAPSANRKSILNWSKIDNPSKGKINGEQVNDTTRIGELTWTKSRVGGLKKIESGESVTIDVVLPVKTSNNIDLASFETFKGKVFADVQYETGGESKNVSSNPVELLFNSDTELEVRDKVAQEPNNQQMYTITWLLSNTFHELKDVAISADFFGDVSFDEKTTLLPPGGKVALDDSKNRLTWTVDTMPISLDVLAYQFKVKLHKPNAGQTQLTSKIRLEATDTVTDEKILKVVEALPLR